MKQTMGKRLLSALLCALLLLSLLPTSALAVQEDEPTEVASAVSETIATESEEASDDASEPEPTTIQVSLTAQAADSFLCPPELSVSVSSDLAESYGYSDSVTDGVSALDVLVRAHELVFGADFTAESCQSYLALSYGWVTLAFGSTDGLGFAVNGLAPNDGVYNATYGSYTGYSVDAAPISSGDRVEFFFYQDDYYLDNYVTITPATSQVGTGRPLTLTLTGYCYCYYSCSTAETIAAMTAPLSGLQLCWVELSTGALTPIDGAITDDQGQVTITAPEQAGTYYLTAYQQDADDTPCFLPLQSITVQSTPTEITVSVVSDHLVDGKLVAAAGDTFQLKAYDQDGRETPVTWSTTASASVITLDAAAGCFTVQSASSGSTSYLTFVATSALDPAVKSANSRFSLTGYTFSSAYRNLTVALSADGQTAKTATLTGGYSGHNVWSYDESAAAGIAQLAADPGTGSSIKFTALRPGSFNVNVALDFDAEMCDTATITVTGVAVEDAAGNLTKTYLTLSEEESAPTGQLTAYCAEGRSIADWSSSNESVATVDENGLVTAVSVGSTLITATDSEGTKGGIKVVVTSAETPYFESLEFLSSAFTTGAWVKDETFVPTKTEYDLPIKSYATAKLALQATTIYDTDRYIAIAAYTDCNGEAREVTINSGAITYLENIPFDAWDLTITLTDLQDASRQTVYTFHVTRPRDTTSTIKASTGMVIAPQGRSLLTTKYMGYAEGTMFKADETGALTSGTGVTTTQLYYHTYLLDAAEQFTLTFTGTTVYTHLRYSVDGGESWTDLPQGGGATDVISFPEGETVIPVQVQVLDDQTYTEQGEFDAAKATTYTLWVEQIGAVSATAQLTDASTEEGDWYPAFQSDHYSYSVVMPNGTSSLTMTYTVTDGATVKLGSAVQTPDEQGVYTMTLKTSAQTLTVTSADGLTTNSYSVKIQARSAYAVPDAVVDYLCINSQYTNITYGLQPEATLGGNVKSLGNFGGYITYYYEDAIENSDDHPYGIDFYVYGNASIDTSTATGCSFFEPGQVWVSEDGERWYALAGSEHYEDDVVWDYSVTYTATASGKTAWTDSLGNSNDGTSKSGLWPTAESYFLNGLVGQDSITLSGILLYASDGSVNGNGSCDAHTVYWGYVDCFANGTIGAAVNPYQDNSDHKLSANGFDLDWAVDADGEPVQLNSVHYVKVVTASNIWHTAFGEKSTEVSYVIRADAAETSVGTTQAPTGITVTDATGMEEDETLSLVDGQQVYSLDLGDRKYINLTVNGVDDSANIYINDQRITAGDASQLFCVTSEGKLVRILVQQGEQEPVIYLLKLTSNAADVPLEGVRVGYHDSWTKATTTDGSTYTLSVDSDVSSVSIAPMVAPDALYTINDAEPQESYALETGENTFTIQVETNARSNDTATLIITRAEEEPEEETDTITVTFALYGDDVHGEGGDVHTYVGGNLTCWIAETSYTVAETATVRDVMEQALTDAGMSWVNASGSYVTSINDLAAFDNGVNSGWLYLLNGSYPSYSIADQTLEDGDAIIFHYTDDYAAEFSDPGDTDPEDPDDEQEPSLPSMDADVEHIYKTTGDYLEQLTQTNAPTVGSVGGDWMVLGLVRSGREVPDGYYENVVAYVQANINDKEQLHRARSTENARVILALTACGYDVTDVGGHDLLQGLSDLSYVKKQGLNGLIFALLAFDCGNYEIPAGTVTREILVQSILDAQLSDGGWALTGSTADADLTAMALQALAPYVKENAAVATAVDAALTLLSETQLADGGYASLGSANSEACAQVIIALTALGIDPATDERFVKNGNSVLDALCSYYVSGGGFRHVADGSLDGMASEQGYCALAAYDRFLTGQTRLYDMTDVSRTENPVVEPIVSEQPGSTGAEETGAANEDTSHAGSSNSAQTTSPQTGDTAPVLGVVALAMLSLMLLLWLNAKRKRSA
jgi:hypothetical protein